MKLNPDDIRRLAKFTLESGPDEVTCEQWLHMVGEYVEAEQRGEADGPAHAQVAKHVAACTHCAEELALLRELLDGEA